MLATAGIGSAWAQDPHAGHHQHPQTPDAAVAASHCEEEEGMQAMEEGPAPDPAMQQDNVTAPAAGPWRHEDARRQRPPDARDPHAYSDGYQLGVGQYALGTTRHRHTELLWGHAVAPCTQDTQRLAQRCRQWAPRTCRWLAFGVQGLAPYWFGRRRHGVLERTTAVPRCACRPNMDC
ncbi:copper resistance protein B [Cupriavidus basilensis]